MVSEFGIGPWRKANEEFVASFEPSYCLFEQRIGAPSSVNLARGSRYENGGVLRTQRCYPGPYEVHAMAPNGISQVRRGAAGMYLRLSGHDLSLLSINLCLVHTNLSRPHLLILASSDSMIAAYGMAMCPAGLGEL